MNNLAYTSQDAAYVGAKVEEKVREEVDASAPLTYQGSRHIAEADEDGLWRGDRCQRLLRHCGYGRSSVVNQLWSEPPAVAG